MFRIIRKLGKGKFSVAYEAEINDAKCVVYFSGVVMNKCQVEFNKVANDNFIKLVDYGKTNDIKVVGMKSEIGKYYSVYAPVLKYTLEEYRKNHKVNFDNVVNDMLNCIKLMKSHGFSHNDIHDGNIMYDGKKWILIDYGNMSCKEYKTRLSELPDYGNDMTCLVWTVVENPILRKMSKVIFASYNKIISRIINGGFMPLIRPYLPNKFAKLKLDDYSSVKFLDKDVKMILYECILLLMCIKHYNYYICYLPKKETKLINYGIKQPNEKLLLKLVKMIE